MRIHPCANLFQMIAVLEETAIVVAILAALELTFEIIVAGRTLLIEAGLAAMFDDLLHPPFLGLRGRIQRLVAVTAHMVDASSDVLALGFDDVSKVELE